MMSRGFRNPEITEAAVRGFKGECASAAARR